MLKGKVKGVYLRGNTYWFAKQVNGRRSFISLETDDYVAAVQRAREIVDAPELQPAQSFRAEVDRAHPKIQIRYQSLQQNERREQTLLPQSICGYREEHPADKRHWLPVQSFLQRGKSAYRREHGGKLHVHAALVL